MKLKLLSDDQAPAQKGRTVMFRVKSLNHTFAWKNFQTPNIPKAIELTTKN